VGLGYAALRLGQKAGVIVLDKGRCMEIAMFAFNAAVAVAFADERSDVQKALVAIDALLQDPSLASVGKSSKAPQSVDIFEVVSTDRIYMRKEKLDDLCRPFGGRKTADVFLSNFRQAGALLEGHDGKVTQSVR